jgi:PAS domain S-box-containing protein
VNFANGEPERVCRLRRQPDMEGQLENPAEEIKRLRRCINDLVSILALPATWSGCEPSQVVRTVLDALLGVLPLDLVYLRLRDPDSERPIEIAWVAQLQNMTNGPQKIGALLNQCLGHDSQKWPSSLRARIAGEDISLAPVRLGLFGEIGIIVAGSRRQDFPRQTDRLLLNVAANQAAIWLQEARLLSEQKRLANELDLRVAEQTVELAAANQELKKEIAERKRTEERIRRIIDTIPAYAWSAGPDGAVDFINRPYLEFTGRPVEELLGWGWRSTCHPDDLPGYLALRRASIAAGVPAEGEVRVRRSDGHYRWLFLHNVPLRDESGNIVKWYGTAMDIEDRKRTEETLRRSEAYLMEAQRLSKTGSFGWNASTDEHFWSEETFRMFHYDPSTKITLQRVLDRIHPEDVSGMKQVIDRAAQEGKDWEHEHRLLLPDGSVKHVHVVAHATRSKSGQPEFVGAVMDVTAARRAEAVLRQKQADLAHAGRVATLGELTSTIAHEVNQPLTAIINNANACLGLVPDSTPQLQETRDALAEIVEDADRASAIIKRVRQLARKTPSDRTLQDMNRILAEVLAIVRYESTARRVTISHEFPQELPFVLGDRIQLQQVLLNLIVNGMDAMNTVEESRRILKISGRGDLQDGKPACLLSVQDTGVGIKSDEMDKLFEAFYTTKPQGMGMGLVISRSIIEAHGGRLWAETHQGTGATFLFSLPAVGNGKI